VIPRPPPSKTRRHHRRKTQLNHPNLRPILQLAIQNIKGNFATNRGSEKLDFEQVNEITWKLTNGEMTQVPACHGFWDGYRITKAIARIIDVGVTKPAWLVRYRDDAA
jgi:hypothetical protein